MSFYGFPNRAFNVAIKEDGYIYSWGKDRQNYNDTEMALTQITDMQDFLTPSVYWDGSYLGTYPKGIQIVQDAVQVQLGHRPLAH